MLKNFDMSKSKREKVSKSKLPKNYRQLTEQFTTSNFHPYRGEC